MPILRISIHASRGGSDRRADIGYNRLIISIHASRGGSDLPLLINKSPSLLFQSTLPAGEATAVAIDICPFLDFISIHASRGGSDHALTSSHSRYAYFNPRFPRGKRLISAFGSFPIPLFQSTLPAGEATGRGLTIQGCREISIHASRGGSDQFFGDENQRSQHFNPRFPRGKRHQTYTMIRTDVNFNPRFPRGKRPCFLHSLQKFIDISIHASRGGSDYIEWAVDVLKGEFQSTLPAGEATLRRLSGLRRIGISIHASRGGSDLLPAGNGTFPWLFQSTLPAGEATILHSSFSFISLNFNPRFPRGKRLLQGDCPSGFLEYFNPRFPRGKRHERYLICLRCTTISIHASRGGSDFEPEEECVEFHPFQSTLPAGEATYDDLHALFFIIISIHASRGGSDKEHAKQVAHILDFNPRFPRGKRLV